MNPFQVHPAGPELQKLIRAETPKFETSCSHGLDGCVEVPTEEHRAILELFRDQTEQKIVELIEKKGISGDRQNWDQTRLIGPLRTKGHLELPLRSVAVFIPLKFPLLGEGPSDEDVLTEDRQAAEVTWQMGEDRTPIIWQIESPFHLISDAVLISD
ncbi:hypothetical protein CGGC5_v005885 [Colletotrichum fructicola Nara gc5]|uniref:Uncharacterized protein n=1 Tax=Colletotrichum fructicola (strain Nara gc5) TaxID=1213859 RepID=A0A7J6JEC6_COLFN|nr:hypothetical protein CGGC5_v005885 [Colletotrichum fructicola Nara gc5]